MRTGEKVQDKDNPAAQEIHHKVKPGHGGCLKKKEASRQRLKNRPALMSQCPKKKRKEQKEKLALKYPSLAPQLMSHAGNLTAMKTIKKQQPCSDYGYQDYRHCEVVWKSVYSSALIKPMRKMLCTHTRSHKH